jgi:hypothetical protein
MSRSPPGSAGSFAGLGKRKIKRLARWASDRIRGVESLPEAEPAWLEFISSAAPFVPKILCTVASEGMIR